MKNIKIMKNIKLFKFKDTCEFESFLRDYGYSFEDIKGWNLAEKRQYCGNVLKIYSIYFNDGEYEYFQFVYFKSFNEYRQTRLGFRGEKLLRWFEDSYIKWYKTKGW